MFLFNLIFGLNFIFRYFKLVIIHLISPPPRPKEKIKLQSRKSYVLLSLPPVSRDLLESHASFFPRESMCSNWFTGGFDCSCEWLHVNMSLIVSEVHALPYLPKW